MKSAFLADCQRRNKSMLPSISRAIRLTLNDHGLQALIGYRLGRRLLELKQQKRGYLKRLFGWPLYFVLRSYARIILDIRLELSADIGAGLYIGHFGNVHVECCKLGEHCSIAQSTHLRADENGEGPLIGNRAWIGAHANITGPFQIGDGATVSAGAVVKRNIPAGALCMGNPARVVLMQYDNSEIL